MELLAETGYTRQHRSGRLVWPTAMAFCGMTHLITEWVFVAAAGGITTNLTLNQSFACGAWLGVWPFMAMEHQRVCANWHGNHTNVKVFQWIRD